MRNIFDEFAFRPDPTTDYRVSMLICSFLMKSLSKLLVIRTYVKAKRGWMSLNFGQIQPLTRESAALERLKISIDIMGLSALSPLFIPATHE